MQLVIAGGIVLFGAALKADLAHFDRVPFIQVALQWMQSWAWLVVVTGPLLVAAVQWFRRKFGAPWAWEAIQKILDEFRDEVFGQVANEPLDHHRVTLFKYKRMVATSASPKQWCDWLVAVARSGHLTKHCIRRFRAPDDGEHCEGVVGRAWRCRDWVVVPQPGSSLPVLTRESNATDLATYAKETSVKPAWVRQQLHEGRPLACSYAALVVRLRGHPWGVLVLDSRKPGTIDPKNLERFKAFGGLLTPLLERI
ncbi:MAG: hypothetical protein ACF8R7_14160 [Phycisphaerales bacterium JB039]